MKDKTRERIYWILFFVILMLAPCAGYYVKHWG